MSSTIPDITTLEQVNEKLVNFGNTEEPKRLQELKLTNFSFTC